MCTVCPILGCLGSNALTADHVVSNENNHMDSNNNSKMKQSEAMFSLGHSWDSGGATTSAPQPDDECEEETKNSTRVEKEPLSGQKCNSTHSYRRRKNFYHRWSSQMCNVPNTRNQCDQRSKTVSAKSYFVNLMLRPSFVVDALVSPYVRDLLRLLVKNFPAIFAILVYSNSLFGHFVHDDLAAIVRNPDVNGQNKLSQIFSNDFWGVPMSSVHSHKSYRPITVLLFRVNYNLCQGNSFCFHGTNVLLHGCATLLLSQVCLSILSLDLISTTVAATIFAVHPIHTEAVSGLVGCADLLACNFTLLSFLTYTRYLKNPKDLKCHLASLIAACFAVLSKETGIMALAINICYGACCHLMSHRTRPGPKTSSNRKMAFKRISTDAFMLGFLLVCRLMLQKCSMLPYFSAQDNPAAFHSSPLTRTLTFLYLPVLNFWLLLCPTWLAYDWQMGSVPLVTSFSDLRFAFILLFYGTLFVLSLGVMRQLRLISCFTTTTTTTVAATTMSSSTTTNKLVMGSKLRTLIAAILFLVLPFLPASNLFFHVGFVLAERILYLPSIGFCLLIGVGTKTLLPRLTSVSGGHTHVARMLRKQQQQHVAYRRLSKFRQSRSRDSSFTDSSEDGNERQQQRRQKQLTFSPQICLALVFFILIVSLFATKTWIKNKDWLSRASLFRSGLKTVPGNAKVHYNYANLLKEEGKLKLAAHHYNQALRLWPAYVMAHNNLATLLSDKTEAEMHLKRALAIDPWHANSLYNLAVLFSERQLCSEAVPLLEKCLSEDPIHERALLLLSDCLLTTPTTTTTTSTTASKKERKLELKKIEIEMAAILEIEEEEEERLLLKLPNGNGANDFLPSKTHNDFLKSQLRTAGRVATSSTSSTTRNENENLTGNVFPSKGVTSFSSRPVGQMFQDEDDASKSNGKISDLNREHLLKSTRRKIYFEETEQANGNGSPYTSNHDELFQAKKMASFLSHLAEVYIGVGHWGKAESVLKRILDAQPHHQVALYQLSQVYLEQNETSSALTAVRSAKSQCKSPNSNSPNVKRSKADDRSGEKYRPCLWGGRCIRRDEICTGILIQEADILREMGYFKLAARNYRQALEVSPSEPQLLLSLGSVHHAMGEWESAWIHYNRCLQIQPDNKVLIANMELLAKSFGKKIVMF